MFLHDAGVAISPDTLFRPFKEFNLDVNASGEISKEGRRIRVDIGQNTNHLQIKFSTFHFERLLRDGLFYQLEGDSVWYSMTNNEMSLVNLESGDTKFTVASAQSLDDELGYYHVTIHKKLRWDEKWWVQILLFVVIVVLISGVMHTRVRRIQRKSELNASQISQLQTVLRQQMNPHFIFNSLTSINHYILQNKRIEASRFLTKFSTLIRNILDYSGGNYITLSEEIDVIDGYLALESLRFKGRFSYSIHVDPSVEKSKVLLPPFIIYPFVERALREGVIHKESKGSIILKFRTLGDYVQCAVIDNGVGLGYFPKNVKKSKNSINKNGTQIAEQRIELYNTLHKEKILLHAEDMKNAVDEVVGTNVLIDFPFIKA
ncbi:MAG: histidine kinase [Salinivirgaceae bacterium]